MPLPIIRVIPILSRFRLQVAGALVGLLTAACGQEDEQAELKSVCLNNAYEVWRAQASCQQYHEMSCTEAIVNMEPQFCQVPPGDHSGRREMCYAEYIPPIESTSFDDWRSLVRSERCNLNLYWRILDLKEGHLVSCQAEAVAHEGYLTCATPVGANRDSGVCQPVQNPCE